MSPRPRVSTPRRASAGAAPSKPSVNPERAFSQFNMAFGLMSVIPLLICFYLISVRFFGGSLAILEGANGAYFLLALIIAMLGLLAGRRVIQEIFQRLVDANQTLRRMYDQQAAFVGNVAHEFRAPLAVMKGALDNLADGLHGSLSSDQAEPVTMSQREASRLARLVNDLLDVTRIEAGRLRLSQQSVVLQELLTSVAQMFSGPIRERGLHVTIDMPEQPVTIIGDRDRLKQVFVNLMGNAVKFTKQGTISVRLTQDHAIAQIEIEDTGPGIAEADLERIFDKFERVGDQSEEGSGLGLPIAKDLIQLHHGIIVAESHLGKGSRFIVTLPMQPPSGSAHPAAPTAARAS
ncbi:MAG: hypothetical protein COV75_08965 [Candidatus Omnitrophica bacterium CG11_big_fil_rev_8_21_14_0_20_63_9]|nr:MAG: hypothetical protein COV75_08965 [Candidatus Omnitrophica bacterium CG11_big_fil_rev_8_21_14_0_20_63_9]